MQRVLIALGIVILLAGLLWPWLGKLPLGRLPGDIVLMTMVIASAVLSLIFWLFRR